ncbi:MAG: hypothetical protein HY314_12015 [Acidobacteria bacterium]|nr:hypothetical protein [Acidobacteriota bacterium]
MDWSATALIEMENNRTERQQRAALTRRAVLYGSMAVGALVICAANLVAIVGTFWEPSRLLTLPLYLMFAAVSLWAGVNFLQTRSRVLFYRDHPDQIEDESVELNP